MSDNDKNPSDIIRSRFASYRDALNTLRETFTNNDRNDSISEALINRAIDSSIEAISSEMARVFTEDVSAPEIAILADTFDDGVYLAYIPRSLLTQDNSIRQELLTLDEQRDELYQSQQSQQALREGFAEINFSILADSPNLPDLLSRSSDRLDAHSLTFSPTPAESISRSGDPIGYVRPLESFDLILTSPSRDLSNDNDYDRVTIYSARSSALSLARANGVINNNIGRDIVFRPLPTESVSLSNVDQVNKIAIESNKDTKDSKDAIYMVELDETNQDLLLDKQDDNI